MLDWIFKAIGTLWDSFWNVVSKLFGSVLIGGVIALLVMTVARIATDDYETRIAVFVGILCAVVRLLINEVAAPLVEAQRARETDRRKLEAKAIFGDAYADDRFKRRQ